MALFPPARTEQACARRNRVGGVFRIFRILAFTFFYFQPSQATTFLIHTSLFSFHQSNEDGPFCSAAPPSPFTLAALVTVVFVPRLSADDGRNSWSRSTAAAGWSTSSSSRRLPAPANRVVPLTIFLTRIRQLPAPLLVALGVVGVAAAAAPPSSLDAEYVPSLQLVGESSTAAAATTSSPLTGSMGGGRGRSFLYRPPADDDENGG